MLFKAHFDISRYLWGWIRRMKIIEKNLIETYQGGFDTHRDERKKMKINKDLFETYHEILTFTGEDRIEEIYEKPSLNLLWGLNTQTAKKNLEKYLQAHCEVLTLTRAN